MEYHFSFPDVADFVCWVNPGGTLAVKDIVADQAPHLEQGFLGFAELAKLANPAFIVIHFHLGFHYYLI